MYAFNIITKSTLGRRLRWNPGPFRREANVRPASRPHQIPTKTGPRVYPPPPLPVIFFPLLQRGSLHISQSYSSLYHRGVFSTVKSCEKLAKICTPSPSLDLNYLVNSCIIAWSISFSLTSAHFTIEAWLLLYVNQWPILGMATISSCLYIFTFLYTFLNFLKYT